MVTTRLRARHVAASFVVFAGLVIAGRRGAADAPQGRYTLTDGGTLAGTVLDTKTGLTWQQAVPASSYTWADAGTYCTSNVAGLPGTGWRLPSVQELQTIVDDSQKSPPSVDPAAFPFTPVNAYWTSSPYVLQAGFAWLVDFDAGYSIIFLASTSYLVRCVR